MKRPLSPRSAISPCFSAAVQFVSAMSVVIYDDHSIRVVVASQQGDQRRGRSAPAVDAHRSNPRRAKAENRREDKKGQTERPAPKGFYGLPEFERFLRRQNSRLQDLRSKSATRRALRCW